MSFSAQLWVLTQAKAISGKTHIVLAALASFEGQRGLFPSHESIAARAGCSVRTVIRSLSCAYMLGIVERTRQRVRRDGRLVYGPNRYRLALVPLEQAKALAKQNAQRLREALNRRKLRLSSMCHFVSEADSQTKSSSSFSRSISDWLDILARIEAGMTPEAAGYS